jgi:hypothetical protein
MKQTAVEWLIHILKGQQDKPFNLEEWMIAMEHAKTMEKEQMCAFAEFVATYPDKNININGEMLHAKSKYDGAERTVDLLETFIVP